ncbi:MAG: deoxyguanosinetriphosphate triphosphohydrolase [Candidatus Tectomicrobia bacterium]|nr:deoxyguanosinetriphosphate triphosphohydrolase [Candidatus Tectomicrobia bacterium]
MQAIREMLEAEERSTLSPKATLSSASKGRLVEEEPCPIRPAFQHDRDRIIHSKSFRRLKHKTQVFLAPLGDHYRTRLTHTLEVAQIARTIAKALRLNESLTEAIALGHDLGHTPFGHAGEAELNKIYPPGFKHAEQSLRVVDILEKDGRGLNLTHEVRDGILSHSKKGKKIFPQEGEEAPGTLEGQIVLIADIVAYVNHDLDDALRANLITEKDPPQDALDFLGRTHGTRIDHMVKDIIFTTLDANLSRIKMGDAVLEATSEIRSYLFRHVYNHEKVRRESIKAFKIVRDLYEYFLEHPQELAKRGEWSNSDESLERGVCDLIAGMTDQYALQTYQEIFLPTPWTEI